MKREMLPTLLVLTLASFIAATMVGLRWIYSGYLEYHFLLWNLFLAWLPLLFALPAPRLRRRPLLLALCGISWLLFLPNAPYLLTDIMHLGRGFGAPLWYDLILLLTFAVTGLLLGFASLDIMHTLMRNALGPVAGWLFAVGCLILSSMGVYIGRFLRWNSWDALLQPDVLLTDLLRLLRDPWNHLSAYVFTLLLALMLWFAYVTLQTLPARERNDPVSRIK